MKTLLYGIIVLLMGATMALSFNEAMESREVPYTVRPGDTLWVAVSHYCKNGEQTRAFVYETAKRNGGSVIHAGDEIVLVVPR